MSATQNISHGYSLGLARSEMAALIFAAGSLAGAIMGHVSFLSAWEAFRNWRIGAGLVGLMLGCCCVIYATTSSLGFVGTARDTSTATRAADVDAYGIAKASALAATAELKKLADMPRSDKRTEAKRAERRSELEAKVAAAQATMLKSGGTGAADPVAEAIASYAAALGWQLEPAKLSPWLTLLAVVFFELGAASSLVVVAALARASEASVDARAGKKAGSKRAKPLDDVVAKLKAAGGRLEGSVGEIGAKLGLSSKSSAHRAFHALAGAGMISLSSSGAGKLVQARGL